MTDDEMGHAIIGAAIKVHSAVGPGLLESAYEACLSYELERQEIAVRAAGLAAAALRGFADR
jgi:GxxExxY protein